MQQNPTPGATAQPGASRSTEFVATTGGEETTSAEVMLVVAYLAMWLIVFALVGLSFRRLTALAGRLAALEKVAPRPAGKGAPAP